MRRTRHTRRTRHKKKHRRRKTRRHYKKRRTRHRRRTTRRRGGTIQVIGGHKENLIVVSPSLGGGKKSSWAISDYPPGFSKFLKRDKAEWKAAKSKKKYRKH